MQGRTDVPLSPEGIAQVRRWRLPRGLARAQWATSPLCRARHTARLLNAREVRVVDALVEMDWGAWSGRTLASLRAELQDAMIENERRGLDFRPPGGESPRMVRARLARWLATLETHGAPLCAVTHKNVIRAALSLATGWDLRRDYPQKLARDALHRFELRPRGDLRLAALNESLLIRG